MSLWFHWAADFQDGSTTSFVGQPCPMSHVDLDFPGMVLRCAWLDQRTAPCTAFLRHDWRQFFGDLGVQIIDGHRKWFLSHVGKTMPQTILQFHHE